MTARDASARASERGPAFERLGTQDSSFLMFEGRHTPMHVSALAIFEGGRLRRPGGALDFGRIREHVASRLDHLPRYRQRIATTPLEGHPVWIDDERFNLDYHVRHTCLPAPGDDAALQVLVGRVLSQQLDRSKPLWEAWVVDGLQDGRFALLLKVHHCMVDGVGGMALLARLLDGAEAGPEAPSTWQPRPRPGAARLLADAALRRSRAPLEAVRALAGAVRHPRRSAEEVARSLAAMGGALRDGFRIVGGTPHNRPIGAHRRVAWCTLDLAEAKALRKRLDCTVNDVVLALVTGAVRRFLLAHGGRVSGLDYRVVIPVDMRAFRPGDEDASGNRVSAWFVSLPVDEPDPLRRVARIREATGRLRGSQAAVGMDWFTRIVDWTGSSLLTYAGVRLAARVHPYHLIVSNVAGPQTPLFLLGARLLGLYPQLPLFESQGLGVAVMSYDGKLCFGLVGDWDVVPDLDRVAEAIGASAEELRAAAEAPGPPGARGSPGRGSRATA